MKRFHSDQTVSNAHLYRIEKMLINLAVKDKEFMNPLSKLIYYSGREINDSFIFYHSALSNAADYDQILKVVPRYLESDTEAHHEDYFKTNDITTSLSHLRRLLRVICLELGVDSEDGEDSTTNTKEDAMTKEMTVINDNTTGSKKFRSAASDHKLQMVIEELNIRRDGMHVDAISEIEGAIDTCISGGPNGSDYTKLMDYLTFCSKLSFGTTVTVDEHDFDKVQTKLDETHYGLDEAKERIMEFLAVVQLKEDADAPKFLMIGGAGTGKTSFANALGAALGRDVQRVALGGVTDVSTLRGHSRTYIGSKAGRIMSCMNKCKVDNPIIILDELDKMGSVGSAESVLLEVLDPEQNDGFVDTYLNFPYDLSKVIFVATANYYEMIDAPLADRLEIIETLGYSMTAKVKIATDYVIPKKIKKLGLKEENVKMTKPTVKALIDGYTREAGVRRMEQAIEKVLRGTVRDTLKNPSKKFSITNKFVEKRLGEPYFTDKDAPDHSIPGTCTGLAYTEVGGVTSTMEVVFSRDLGLHMTGEAGSMLRNSLKVAMTNVSNNAAYIGADIDLLDEVGLHAQLGDGATNTDGPSAGILFATSIASLLTDTPVKERLGMTGELRLNGRVTAIGGLEKKIPGGYRAGLREFIIPKENEKNLRDVPKEILKKVKIHCVEHVSEVFKIALGIDLEEGKEAFDRATEEVEKVQTVVFTIGT